jgi:predicted amidohydrolase
MKLKVGLLLTPEKSLNEAVEVLREKAQALKEVGCRLLVAPEGFLSWGEKRKVKRKVPKEEAWGHLKEVATQTGIALACGYQTPKGGELMLWYDPVTGVEREYCKHSMSAKREMAPNQEDWETAMERYLFTIPLDGWQVNPQICYDLSMPFLPEASKSLSGADILLNISGSNVVWKKWATYLQARAVQLNAHVLCCMHHNHWESNAGMAAHFTPFGERSLLRLSDGQRMWSREIWQWARQKGEVCEVFVAELEKPIQPEGRWDVGEAYSQQTRTARTESKGEELLTLGVETGDLQVRLDEDRLKINEAEIRCGEAQILTVKEYHLVVCHLLREQLPDPIPLWQLLVRPEHDAADGFLAIYTTTENQRLEPKELCLLAARAMEARIAVAVLSPAGINELMVTTNYRIVQRLAPTSGNVFGLPLQQMRGPKSLYRDNNTYPALDKVRRLLERIAKPSKQLTT